MTYGFYAQPAAAAQRPLTPAKVAKAYNLPIDRYTGKGELIGVIELGGRHNESDLDLALQYLGVTMTGKVTAKYVDGAKPVADGVNGATGEVALDVQVIAALAPGADQNVYFGPNTDQGFYDAIKAAADDHCTAISISWGGPESSWDRATALSFDDLIGQARKAGTVTFCASGDQGAKDGTSRNVADFPASASNSIGCGGTTLFVAADGTRAQEEGWSDNARTSASGGGVSGFFAGRHVPDVAGNADPDTGWPVVIDGQLYTFGGTSAVAPLYAALTALLSEAVGAPVGTKVDLMNTFLTNLGAFYDVVSGDPRVGPGRDDETGLGVVDGEKLLSVLTDSIGDPAPVPPVNPPPTTVADQVKAILDKAEADVLGLL